MPEKVVQSSEANPPRAEKLSGFEDGQSFGKATLKTTD